jgi:hypothetical protein
LSCDGGQSLKPAVAQDGGIARYFDENVFKQSLKPRGLFLSSFPVTTARVV